VGNNKVKEHWKYSI